MAANEPLVPLAEIERQAQWVVRADADGAVVSDWAGRAAVPASVAAVMFERAVAERNQLALERQQRHLDNAAKTRTPLPLADARLQALADNGMRNTR